MLKTYAWKEIFASESNQNINQKKKTKKNYEKQKRNDFARIYANSLISCGILFSFNVNILNNKKKKYFKMKKQTTDMRLKKGVQLILSCTSGCLRLTRFLCLIYFRLTIGQWF